MFDLLEVFFDRQFFAVGIVAIRVIFLDVLEMLHDGDLPGEALEVFFRHFFRTDEREFSLGDGAVEHEVDQVAATNQDRDNSDEEIVFEEDVETKVNQCRQDQSFEDLLSFIGVGGLEMKDLVDPLREREGFLFHFGDMQDIFGEFGNPVVVPKDG